MTAQSRMKIRVLFPHPEYAMGQIIEVPEIEPGVPADLYWRRRIRDAATDQCVEIVQDEAPKRRRTSAASTDGEE